MKLLLKISVMTVMGLGSIAVHSLFEFCDVEGSITLRMRKL